MISYTIYAKCQPRPLVGDELYPDGCVGIHIPPTPSLSCKEVRQLAADLAAIADLMERR